jgi:3-oxoacyl-[acyl-carrier protein] reductase
MSLAVVTGAGQGIGRAIAVRLAAEGYEVVAVDVDAERAARTASLTGGRAATCDVAEAGAVAALADGLRDVEVLVNNAGIWRLGGFLDATASGIEEVIRVNLLGTALCCHAFAPVIAGRGGGAIVNISSAAVAMAAPGTEIYPATKGAVEILTRQLALELGASQIRVNAVGPGLIVTEGTAGNYEGDKRAAREAAVPLHRVGVPEDIANAVAFLVSDQASYITGQWLHVDGGVGAGQTGR